MACFQRITWSGQAENPGPTARGLRRSKVPHLLDFHLP